MAKRIKVKDKKPRGLSKAQRRKIAPIQQKLDRVIDSERRRVDPFDMDARTADLIERLDYQIEDIAERPDISHGSSSERKKLVKEGNRKFIGPRQFRNELKEDRGRRSLRNDRRFNRMMSREYLEQDDPTVNVEMTGVGKLRGGLSPEVVAALKKALLKVAAKPQKALTAKELKFLSTVDATGRFLGNYPGISRA
jgi:hypothetical protein